MWYDNRSYAQQDIINIDLKHSAGWEDLDDPLTLGKKKKRFFFLLSLNRGFIGQAASVRFRLAVAEFHRNRSQSPLLVSLGRAENPAPQRQ